MRSKRCTILRKKKGQYLMLEKNFVAVEAPWLEDYFVGWEKVPTINFLKRCEIQFEQCWIPY